MYILGKNTDNYTLSLHLMLPTISSNGDNKFAMKKYVDYKYKEISFNTYFLLTSSSNHVMFKVAILGFGLGFSLITKDNYES